jgi:hypothetical protein
MAFTAEKLAVNESGNTNGGGFHQYTDKTITMTTMSGGGYFNDAFALKDGQLILLTGSDGIALKTIDRTAGLVSLAPTNSSLNQVLVTAATLSPTVLQNGSSFILQKAAGVAVTLPAPATGLKYRFIHGGPVLSSVGHIITATDIIVYGSTVCAGLVELIAAADTITFANGASIIGDECTIESDGTNWYISGIGSVDNAIVGSAA